MAKKRVKQAKAVPHQQIIVGHHPSLPGVIVRVTILEKGECLVERSPYRQTSISLRDGSPIESTQTFAPITEPIDLHKHLIAALTNRPAEWPV
ncbi:hypothetical protein [Fibrella forsythiae]|uniref:Uncharacterized protein n=1 Tax=Fibrella forsythiae TaxID=2817061 RepID=A0ABS3JDH9_9BACT|nr:hypothetical protein [Fibrella forsythiae]MBO0947324.1 hypothetical protein [Fibrella forsythiae]